MVQGIRLGRMTALRKPSGGVRGIVVGDTFRKANGIPPCRQATSGRKRCARLARPTPQDLSPPQVLRLSKPQLQRCATLGLVAAPFQTLVLPRLTWIPAAWWRACRTCRKISATRSGSHNTCMSSRLAKSISPSRKVALICKRAEC